MSLSTPIPIFNISFKYLTSLFLSFTILSILISLLILTILYSLPSLNILESLFTFYLLKNKSNGTTASRSTKNHPDKYLLAISYRYN